ncbi:hypothetical protein AVEN_213507-1 [Araneus ventricosus]|uniref:Uncharacterized protein n=1 Tax=Araneus ventricosus TaxID=182803 RepID=A0A4Y2TSL9_ARAVE|nr:hypothetical protein AVEN_213507-1 [Araneus ventricosus]
MSDPCDSSSCRCGSAENVPIAYKLQYPGHNWDQNPGLTAASGNQIYSVRFKKLGSPLCACGLFGDADHYVFRCPLTAEFHLKEPSDEHRKSWFKKLRHNGQAQSKLIPAYKISNGICDQLTQG